MVHAAACARPLRGRCERRRTSSRLYLMAHAAARPGREDAALAACIHPSHYTRYSIMREPPIGHLPQSVASSRPVDSRGERSLCFGRSKHFASGSGSLTATIPSRATTGRRGCVVGDERERVHKIYPPADGRRRFAGRPARLRRCLSMASSERKSLKSKPLSPVHQKSYGSMAATIPTAVVLC